MLERYLKPVETGAYRHDEPRAQARLRGKLAAISRGLAWLPWATPAFGRVARCLRELNTAINEREAAAGAVTLASTPPDVVVGTHYRCNADCRFCLKGHEWPRFSFAWFQRFIERKAGHLLRAADSISFCGYGEILLLPEIEAFIGYCNRRYPQAKKIFTTNGIALRKQLVDLFSDENYVFQISLHAASAPVHEAITQTRAFDQVLEQIRYLVARKGGPGRGPYVVLTTVVNRLNLRELPRIVELARDLGVDEVRFDAMTIHSREQVQYSCFFQKELTNEMLDAARAAADRLGMRATLPPRYRLETAPAPAPAAGGAAAPATSPEFTRCRDPWRWCFISDIGVTHCCHAGQSVGRLQVTPFATLWNNEIYRSMRSDLVARKVNEWCRDCPKADPALVDRFEGGVAMHPVAQEEVLS